MRAMIEKHVVLWLGFMLLFGCESDPEVNADVDVLDATSSPDASDMDTSATRDTLPDDTPSSGLLCGLLECLDGELCCDYACVDPSQSAEHCGACGRSCAADEQCVGGLCACGDALCGEGSTCCVEGDARACAELSTDPENCGACGLECGEDMSCQGGRCACLGSEGAFESCGEDETCCPGLGCVALDVDATSCGACGVLCGAGELCVEGECRCGDATAAGGPACGTTESCCGSPATCKPVDDSECDCGTALCGSGQACCDMAGSEGCASLVRDRENCGGCGVSCSGGAVCRNAACVCPAGLADCGDGSCETPLNIDPSNCGGCGVVCEAGEVCDGRGGCALTCQSGLVECEGRCVNLDWDRQNCGGCGLACEEGEVCDGVGGCASTCQAGFVACDGVCVELTANRHHCGACGQACGPGEVCDGAGSCALTCVPGAVECGGACVDLASDRSHCGGCGQACASGEVCDLGECQVTCRQGREVCGGRCVDIESDRAHCGGCGLACEDPGARCIEGACRIVCSEGAQGSDVRLCDGRCVDVMSSPRHCGACGAPCGDFERCVEGACELSCVDGFELCDGVCVDTRSSASHCGACGQACGVGEVCLAGSCCPPLGCGSNPVVSIDASIDTCAVLADGTVECWGDALYLGLGGGARTVDVPERVALIGQGGNPGAVRVVTGWKRFGCALLDEAEPARDTVTCWGVGSEGQHGDGLGVDSWPVPNLSARFEVPGSGEVVDWVAGQSSACLRLSDESLYCWGSAVNGAGSALSPVRIDLGGPVRDVDMSQNVACAVVRDGANRVYCWGQQGGDLRLGWSAPGASTDVRLPSAAQPVQREDDGQPLEGVVAVAMGQRFESYAHGCAVLESGDVYCWGRSNEGQTGCPSCTSATLAQKVTLDASVLGTDKAVGVFADAAYTCVVLETSAVACFGELPGLGVDVAPTLLLGVDGEPALGIEEVSGGTDSVCARNALGQMRCWGAGGVPWGGTSMQTEAGPTFPQLPAHTRATALSVRGRRTCAVVEGRGVYCWGDVDPGSESSRPVGVPGTRAVVELAQGMDAACGVDSAGDVLCWGDASYDLSGLPGRVTVLGAGLGFFCAALAEGGVVCWGEGGAGQLGDGGQSDSSVPVAVQGLDGEEIVQLAGGDTHMCALVSGGAVWCWGSGESGELGDGQSSTSAVPVEVSGLNGVDKRATFVAAGASTSCALVSDGSVWCWGDNTGFPIGFGATSYAEPTSVALSALQGESVVAVAAGRHTCMLTDLGALWCQYDNTFGQIAPPGSPFGGGLVLAGGLQDDGLRATQVVVGEAHTCVLLDSGEVRCWGDNARYELGVADALTPSIPLVDR